MNSHRTHHTTHPQPIAPRAGLAPLELVMSLPLMLCVMALMINFGNAGTWKIRASTSARLASWRSRPLWGANNDPKPSNWFPPTATMGTDEAPRVPTVDAIWNDPLIAQTWIKGPVFFGGNGYIAVRNNRVNEMSEGLATGNANLSLQYPFMPAMGMMSLRADHHMAQTLWQYHSMGYGLNNQRRAKGWWNIEDSPDWASQKQRFLAADDQMKNHPQRETLRPLDRDPELLVSGQPFDFYPRAPSICSNDVNEVQAAIKDWLPQIAGRRGVPGVTKRMATSYLRMYEQELALLQQLPNPPAARIAQLKQWIEQLKDLIGQLP